MKRQRPRQPSPKAKAEHCDGQRRGRAQGYKQRLQREEPSASPALDPPTIQHSAVACLLLNELYWGYMQAAKVRAIAKACAEDGLDHEDILKLANLSQDSSIGHAWRNLKNRMVASPVTDCIFRPCVTLKTHNKE